MRLGTVISKNGVPALESNKILTWIILISTAAYIGVYLCLSFYAHPAADDFNFANKLIQEGFLNSQHSTYLTWSGRYTSTALISGFIAAFDLLHGFWLLPLFLIVTTGASFVALAHSIWKESKPTLTILCYGLSLTALYLSGLPSMSETIYWLAGGITYQLGNSLYVLLLAVLIKLHRGEATTRLVAAAGLLVLVIAGLNETIMLLQTMSLAVMATYAFARKTPQRQRLLMLTLTSLVGAAIVAVAPGNAVRSSYFPAAHDIVFSIKESVRWGAIRFVLWGMSPVLWPATLLWVAATASNVPSAAFRPRFANAGCAALLWLSMLAAMFFPAFWSMGSAPPHRTLSINYMLFLVGWFLMVSLGTSLLPVKKLTFSKSFLCFIAAIFALCLFTTGNGGRALKDLAIAPEYSKQLNERYKRIELHGGQAVELKVPVLSQYPGTIFSTDISTQKDDWKNVSYAQYFRLQAIATTYKKL